MKSGFLMLMAVGLLFGCKDTSKKKAFDAALTQAQKKEKAALQERARKFEASLAVAGVKRQKYDQSPEGKRKARERAIAARKKANAEYVKQHGPANGRNVWYCNCLGIRVRQKMKSDPATGFSPKGPSVRTTFSAKFNLKADGHKSKSDALVMCWSAVMKRCRKAPGLEYQEQVTCLIPTTNCVAVKTWKP